ncbi:uncharacterized protein EI97DRAFT_375967 [Westerdykella ornata]|uniref:Uncharacterized protein n=1 Tax=Westerdykella ornata TaxID=318751 RepID=A0A6A6JLM2_WESOR|nr:uncharacterized protein EI97DRAFT_375967 [Westerdykella ornata]KAF2277135.1 hypothetical protein EI97DRAFT_375967 [Westerdykella ornata]
MTGFSIRSFATTEAAIAAPVVNTPKSIRSAMSIENLLSDPVEGPASQEPASSPSQKTATCDAHEAGSAAAQDLACTDEDMVEPSDAQDSTGAWSSIEREFECMYDEYSQCRTGQYTLSLARKVISNHFGRNKACTRLIDDWPLFCRKHYQRATYNSEQWQRRKVALIIRQFGIINTKYPGMTYTVALKKSEMDRLNTFARAMDAGLSPQEAGAKVAPVADVKSFQAPIDVLRELQHHLGPNKTMADVTQTMVDINKMLQDGDTKEIPAIEFLMEAPETKTTKSPQAVSKASPAGARVSPKGAVKKPGRK